MFNNLLIINGYIICISNCNNKLTGAYVKGTNTRIDNLIELENKTIEEFRKKRETIAQKIVNGQHFVLKYDYKTNTFKAKIREKNYKGPYAEETVYNTIYESNNGENIFLALNSLEKDILKKHKVKSKQKLY